MGDEQRRAQDQNTRSAVGRAQKLCFVCFVALCESAKMTQKILEMYIPCGLFSTVSFVLDFVFPVVCQISVELILNKICVCKKKKNDV
jgi:hypothetical protein